MHIEEADAYCRYSNTLQDEGNSIEYQMEEIQAYADRKNIRIRKWYIDKAKTAKKVAGRDEFYELLNDIKNGDSAPNLIVWRTNRAFRNSYESHKYRNMLREHNVKLHSVTQNIDEDTSTGRLTTSILSDIDQYKSEEIAEHVIAALRSMVKKGFYTGQRIPLGYTTEPAFDGKKPRKKYAIDEKTAPIVRKLFNDFISGIPLYAMLEWLQEQGIYTSSGKPYDSDALRYLLQNEMYIGTRKYKVKGQDMLVVPNSIPPIIDERTFDTVQQIFHSRKKDTSIKGRKSTKNRVYILTGKIICQKCNNGFMGRVSNGYTYYMCSRRFKRKDCDCKSIRKEHLEKAVIGAIRDNIMTDAAINNIANIVLDEIKKNPPKSKRTKEELIKQKNKLLEEMAELTQMKLDKEISKDLFLVMKKPKEEELAEIEMELHIIEQQKKSVIDEDFIKSYINDLFTKVESGKDELLKVVVENTVDKIIINDSEVEICLALSFNKNTHKKPLAFTNWDLSVKLDRKSIKK